MPRTHYSDAGTRYVAGHLLSDFCQGAVDAETAAFFLQGRWIDDLRTQAKSFSPREVLVDAICGALADPAVPEQVKNFGIIVSRWIESLRIVDATRTLLESGPPIPLYISAVLHLANHVQIDAGS